jgi:hypothetical protein
VKRSEPATIEDVRLVITSTAAVLFELAGQEPNPEVRVTLEGAYRHMTHAHTFLLAAQAKKGRAT